MKIFIYKTAVITFIFVIVFEILIGSRINNLKKQIYELSSQQNREQIIIKIKEEIKKANRKEKYLNEEDRVLLSTFLKKIIKELDLNSN
jgi:K+-sensing histidine kinase KdpD